MTMVTPRKPTVPITTWMALHSALRVTLRTTLSWLYNNSQQGTPLPRTLAVLGRRYFPCFSLCRACDHWSTRVCTGPRTGPQAAASTTIISPRHNSKASLKAQDNMVHHEEIQKKAFGEA
ncbi:Cytochrome P450 [Macrophomina phaseolina MS6]|uniref:Cytochrome P450 n=1 Tax=Macrophomina phaseolina (strain MS6) TaxID=1126212 RepID=K2S178_MACPH|nr:Cytochrome P450 [Macrophomina phaseolina MS6]